MRKYEITKEQIQHLSGAFGAPTSRLDECLKEWFPEAFEKPFSLNKWYKSKNHPKMLVYPTEENIEGHLYGYGFNNYGDFISITKESASNCLCNSTAKDYLKEATTEEVKEALIAEAKKIGYKNGNYKCLLITQCTNKVKDTFHFNHKENMLFHGASPNEANNVVFRNGKWAEIIETISREEAEKLLNKKII